MKEKTVSEAIEHRRSIRVFKKTPLNSELVKECLKLSHLAPTSSNMQLWEFYHVTDKSILSEITTASFHQNAAKTAQEMVVVVTRKDLWKKRALANRNFIEKQFSTSGNEQTARRKKMALAYYSKVVPGLYSDFFGIFGAFKYLLALSIGIFRPMYRQTRWSDMRIVAHKSAALAAQNFMLSMTAIGYDTCPMEGFDSVRVKSALNLPRTAEINMVIGCGIREPEGVYGERFRVPFEEVYIKR